jgi:hypothetical protein
MRLANPALGTVQRMSEVYDGRLHLAESTWPDDRHLHSAVHPCDTATWPAVLTIDQVAAVYQRSVPTIRKPLQARTFTPPPYQTHPYRWRKSDVVRDVRGNRLS